MTRKDGLLERLSIPSPCPANWSDLIGDERKRYCEQCNKHVYDFSQMTATEAVALVSALRGQVCARITRQADGTLLTEEPLPVLPLVRRRASPLASAAVTTMLAVSAYPAGAGSVRADVVQTSRDFGTPIPDQISQTADKTASIAGTVFDQNEAVIPGAKVSLINDASGETRVVTTSDVGKFQFTGLSQGTFSIRVETSGFSTSIVQHVTVSSQQEQQLEQRVQVTMEAALEMSVTSGVVALSMPKPLRVLYNDSDLIVVARIGKSKTVEREREARLVKTALRVSTLLKGKDVRSTVDLYHWSYGDLEEVLVEGEEVLLFLKRSRPDEGRKARDGYEVEDTQYGIKKLAGNELKAYLDRIAELSQISRENGPIEAAIVEWLVRCAEDPRTRWEGACELVSSIDRRSDPDADEDTDEEADSESTASSSSATVLAAEQASATDKSAQEEEDTEEETDFVSLLTSEQKTRLMSALFQTEQVRHGDFQLIELAEHWKEPRLVPFLIEQLRRLEANPPRLAERLMDSLAAALNDKAIVDLAEEYQENVSYPDEDTEGQSSDTSPTSDGTGRTEEAAAAIQTRSEILKKFLHQVEVMLAGRRSG